MRLIGGWGGLPNDVARFAPLSFIKNKCENSLHSLRLRSGEGIVE